MAKKERFVTPRGLASYPFLNTPDTKFDEEGEYKVNLVLDESEALNKLINKLEQIRDDFVQEDDRCRKVADQIEFNDIVTEDEEGHKILKFKQKAKIRSKKGEVFEKKVALFDAKGHPITDIVGYNSVIKVSFEVYPYFMPATKGKYARPPMVGLTLRPAAVQVLELHSGGEGDASSFGFGEEDGYESSEEATAMGFDEAEDENIANDF